MGLSNNLGKLSNMITSTGSAVGIAQASPAYTLDVSGSGRYNGSYAGHLLNVQNTNASYYSSTDYYDNAGTEKLIVGYGNASTGNALASKAIIYGTSGVGLNFYTNGSTTAKMVIDTSGDVSIGTTSTNANTKVKIKASSEGSTIGLSSSTLCIARSATDTFLSIGYYSTPDAFLISASYGADGAYKPIAFATSDVERARISATGVSFQVGTNSAGAVDWIARFKNATSTGYGVDIQAATDSQSSALLVRSYTGAYDFFSVRGDGVIFTGNASRSPYNDVSAAGANLIVVSGGNLQRSTSSLRFKTNVEDLYTDASSLIYKMRPIWYRSLGYTDRKDWSWYGFIAEEMAEIEPRLVQWGKDENDNDIADGIQYERISVLLVAEMQKMNKLVQELSAQNQDLKSRLDKAGL